MLARAAPSRGPSGRQRLHRRRHARAHLRHGGAIKAPHPDHDRSATPGLHSPTDSTGNDIPVGTLRRVASGTTPTGNATQAVHIAAPPYDAQSPQQLLRLNNINTPCRQATTSRAASAARCSASSEQASARLADGTCAQPMAKSSGGTSLLPTSSPPTYVMIRSWLNCRQSTSTS